MLTLPEVGLRILDLFKTLQIIPLAISLLPVVVVVAGMGLAAALAG
jgi:hypothetical protein